MRGMDPGQLSASGLCRTILGRAVLGLVARALILIALGGFARPWLAGAFRRRRRGGLLRLRGLDKGAVGIGHVAAVQHVRLRRLRRIFALVALLGGGALGPVALGPVTLGLAITVLAFLLVAALVL